MVRTIAAIAIATAVGCHASPTHPGPTSQAAAGLLPVAQPINQTLQQKWRGGQPIRAVVMGNSISVGYYATGWERIALSPDRHLIDRVHDLGGGAVVDQLRRLVLSRNAQSVLVNESMDGARSLSFYSDIEIRRIVAAAPRYDVAFIALQVNDGITGLELEAFNYFTNLLIDFLLEAGIQPVLVKENSTFEDYVGTLAAEIDKIAAARGVSVVDGYTPFRKAVVDGGGIKKCGLFFDNGIHPNQAGHDILFNAYEKWFNQ